MSYTKNYCVLGSTGHLKLRAGDLIRYINLYSD
jgi:hypothetical protein